MLHVIGGIVVRQPYIRVAPGIQADTTANRGYVRHVKGKAKARLQKALTVNSGVVAETVVGQEVRVDRRLVAGRKPVITQTGND